MIRKGTYVRCIGTKNLYGYQDVFMVHEKKHNYIKVLFPIKYLYGDVRREFMWMPLEDFEEIK